MDNIARPWVKHDGKGRPVPRGTYVDIRHFNGDVSLNVEIGGNTAFGADGTRGRGPYTYNGWNFTDGGPMGPKFKEYRLAERELTMESFRAMLNAPVREVV